MGRNATVFDAYPCTYVPVTQPVVRLDPMRQFSGNLSAGQSFVFTVRVFNRAGVFSQRQTAPIRWDVLTPGAGVVWDGLDSDDVDYQLSTSQLHAAWSNFSFESLSVGYFEACVVQSPNVTVSDWENVGLRTSATFNLTLTPFATYFVRVRATEPNTLLQAEARSNGIRIVTQAATPGRVYDGSVVPGVDLDWSINTTHFSANWDGFLNQGVPLVYSVTLQSMEDGMGIRAHDMAHYDLHTWSQGWWQSPVAAAPMRGLHRLVVCATNPVLLKTCVASDGVMMDDAAPSVGIVQHGKRSDAHQAGNVRGAQIDANWVRTHSPVDGQCTSVHGSPLFVPLFLLCVCLFCSTASTTRSAASPLSAGAWALRPLRAICRKAG